MADWGGKFTVGCGGSKKEKALKNTTDKGGLYLSYDIFFSSVLNNAIDQFVTIPIIYTNTS